MMKVKWHGLLISILGVLLVLPLSALAAGPTAAEIALIEKAAPDKATVKPQKPRKLLVIDLCKGYRHSSIPYWDKALEIMGRKSGAYTTVISEDLNLLKPENIQQFDAVCFNNTTHLEIKDPAIRKGLMDFIKGGKGIVGIHAATDNFYNWPEMMDIMGGKFIGHPWGAGGTWVAKYDDLEHPLMAAFRDPRVRKKTDDMHLAPQVFSWTKNGFKVKDEIYRTRGPLYNRIKLRVFMSLDMTAPENLKVKDRKPYDKDIGLSWINTAGKGRMFYGSMGHNPHITWIPVILQHYLDGIQWAMGDLQCQSKSKVELALEKIATYKYGQSREPLNVVADYIRNSYGMPETIKVIEERLIKFLEADTTQAGKSFVCRQLSLIGTQASVPVLSKLLVQSQTSDIARYALERIEGPAVNKALEDALAKTSGKAKIGVISTLGQRKDTGAVSLLSELIFDSNKDIAAAAITALGQIADESAIAALSRARDKARGDLRDMILDAYLRCGDQLADAGKTSQALAIYKDVFRPGAPTLIRIAALRGMVYAGSDEIGQILIDILHGNDKEMQAVAISLVGEVKGTNLTRKLTAELPKLAPTAQVQLISALGSRGDKAALGAIIRATTYDNADVRKAAFTALARLGDASVVNLLAQAAANSSGEEKKAAEESLYRLRGEDVDKAILQSIPTAGAKAKVELIKSIDQRGIKSATGLLLQTAQDSDRRVRRESLRVLGDIGTPAEVAPLVKLLSAAKSSSDRRMAGLSISAILHRNKNAGLDAVVGAYNEVGAKAKVTLLAVLGKTGADSALPVLRSALKDNDPAIKKAAIKAVTDWPTPAPMNDVLAIAKNDDNLANHVLALRAYIKLVAIKKQRPRSETVKLLSEAMAIARRADEKKAVLGVLPQFAGPEALQLAASKMSDPALANEAKLAVQKIKAAMK